MTGLTILYDPDTGCESPAGEADCPMLNPPANACYAASRRFDVKDRLDVRAPEWCPLRAGSIDIRREPRRCGECGHEIDPDWCWCGNTAACHTAHDGHSFCPMGCVCGFDSEGLL